MTIYQCSCGKWHDTAKDPPCPQVVATFAMLEPRSPDATTPIWDRRYFCPQCPSHAQPPDGFEVVSFQEHIHGHAINALREAMIEGDRMRHHLRKIRSTAANLQTPEWAEARGNGVFVTWQMDYYAAQGLGEAPPEPPDEIVGRTVP